MRRSLTILLLAGVLASCTNATTDSATSSADALSGTAQTIDGASIDLAAYRDSDLVVWFWAPW